MELQSATVLYVVHVRTETLYGTAFYVKGEERVI